MERNCEKLTAKLAHEDDRIQKFATQLRKKETHVAALEKLREQREGDRVVDEDSRQEGVGTEIGQVHPYL